MFTRIVTVFLAAVVLLTGSPALAQSSSDLLASAERAALTMAMEQDLEQDQSVVRRRRSGGVGAVGAVLTGVGIYLALQPPDCDLVGEPTGAESYRWAFQPAQGTVWRTFTYEYTATRLRGECVVRAKETIGNYIGAYDPDVVFQPQSNGRPYGADPTVRVIYSSDEYAPVNYDPFTLKDEEGAGGARSVIEKKTMNQIGWATAAAGGVLLVWGLRGVDVPVRLDVAPAGGFRISRSFGW